MTTTHGLTDAEMKWLKRQASKKQTFEIKVMEPELRCGKLDYHWTALKKILKAVDPPAETYHPDSKMIDQGSKLLQTWFPSATDAQVYRLLQKNSIFTLCFVSLSYCLAKEFCPRNFK
jgi:hypothetical protein